MPITAKVTFNLRYKQAGNSFTLFNVTPSLEQLGNTADDKPGPIDRMWRYYLQLLGSGVEGPNVRISDEAVLGDSLFFDKQYVTIRSGGVPEGDNTVVQVKCIEEDDPDFYDTSLLLTLAASSTQKGRIFMRFIPDSVVDYPVGFNPTRAWVTGFEAWRKNLIADKWCIRSLVDANINKRFPIKSITRAAAGDKITVVTFNAHGLLVGDTIRVSRAVGSPGTNRIWTVATKPSDTEVTLLDSEGTVLNVGKKGTVRKLFYSYPPITRAAFRYITRRKSGRPFGTPVGRVRKRSLSQ